jgi:hypothetical protein
MAIDMTDPRLLFPKGASRLDEKTIAIRNEKILEAACKKAVWKRDEGICRCCGTKVIKALELTPKRAESHHIVGRADWAVRFDPRNRVLVCAVCHEAIERNRILIVGTARQMFTAENGKSYLNADCPLEFRKAA